MTAATVYRMYDAAGRLLYVGCSARPNNRISDHRRTAWWPGVDRIEREEFADRAAAFDAEARAIIVVAIHLRTSGALIARHSPLTAPFLRRAVAA